MGTPRARQSGLGGTRFQEGQGPKRLCSVPWWPEGESSLSHSRLNQMSTSRLSLPFCDAKDAEFVHLHLSLEADPPIRGVHREITVSGNDLNM